MSKKNFKGGLDSLLSGSLDKNKTSDKDEPKTKKEVKLTEEDKHFLQEKNDRLLKELHLWRTGRLDIKSFHESLKTKGLKYDAEKNIIY